MKKTYMIPANKVVVLDLNDGILNPVSGGVGTGASLLNEFKESDVSYSKKSIWDDDEEW